MRTLVVEAICAWLVLAVSLSAPAAEAPSFSSLPAAQQKQIREFVEPPPLARREGCYSVPMYYLMYAGYKYDGTLDKVPADRTYIKDKPGPDYGHWTLDRNRPDWQEAMIRDWAELGLNNTHLDIYPIGDQLSLPASYLKAIDDFASLSAKYGLKVGVRLDAPGDTSDHWGINPENPQNRLAEYLNWVGAISKVLKGRTIYYVLGDEWKLHQAGAARPPHSWTPGIYLDFFRQVSAAIKRQDPQAKVSMFSVESDDWSYVLEMLRDGYARYGDAVAINHYDEKEISRDIEQAHKLAPGLLFLSNGVGYCSNSAVEPRYPQGDPYSKLPTEQAQANAIAETMFSWWDVGAATAPYYISLRNWVINGVTYPRWFGFFGFEDYVIDHDALKVRRYPAWYAYQTITHVFYNRADFHSPKFAVKTSRPLSRFRAYTHSLGKSSELLMMLWDDRPGPVTVTIGSDQYAYPVRIANLDYRKWTDISSQVLDHARTLKLTLTKDPMIIRLIRLP